MYVAEPAVTASAGFSSVWFDNARFWPLADTIPELASTCPRLTHGNMARAAWCLIWTGSFRWGDITAKNFDPTTVTSAIMSRVFSP
jgi:hypothetical protein